MDNVNDARPDEIAAFLSPLTNKVPFEKVKSHME
jgi:hypothetical protein